MEAVRTCRAEVQKISLVIRNIGLEVGSCFLICILLVWALQRDFHQMGCEIIESHLRGFRDLSLIDDSWLNTRQLLKVRAIYDL